MTDSTKAEAKRELRKAIVQDCRANFVNWPGYLEDFEAVLTADEIKAEAERVFRRAEKA